MWTTQIITVVFVLFQLVSGDVLKPERLSTVEGKADIRDYPYHVSILEEGRYLCGGAIIDKKFVLTAAHCTKEKTVSSLTVRAGSNYYSSEGQLLQVYSIHIHENFSPISLDNDIAVLKLTSDFDLNDETTWPVTLVNEEDHFEEGEIAVATGFGGIGGNYYRSDVLQKSIVPIYKHEDCVSDYANNSPKLVTHNMICAGYEQGGNDEDILNGDSGGPLVLNGRIIGVKIWDFGNSRVYKPGVYINVKFFRGFIRQIIGY